MTTETGRIVDQLERAFDGDAWHGPPLRRLLDNLDAATAAAHPVPGAHSIWELTVHAAFWMQVVRRRLAGEIVGESGDWEPVQDTSSARWTETLAALDDSHRKLLTAVRALSDVDLERVVPSMGYTNYVMLHGEVQHNLYHAGQIALLLRASQPRT